MHNAGAKILGREEVARSTSALGSFGITATREVGDIPLRTARFASPIARPGSERAAQIGANPFRVTQMARLR